MRVFSLPASDTSLTSFPAFAFLLGVFVSGCVSLPRAPTMPTDDSRFAGTNGGERTGMEDSQPLPLTVYPGDVIAILALSAEETEYEGLLVDERGRVHLPLAGPVEIGGLAVPEAEQRLTEAMRRFDRVVQVSLRIAVPDGHRATVLGAVGRPGRFIVVPGMRMADALADAGGPGGVVEPLNGATGVPPADLEGATVTRQGRVLPISLARAVEGDPRHNIRVLPGDHLYIPPARDRAIVVIGAVNHAGVFAYRQDIRLTEAVARAGGLNERGDRTDIHIVRGNLREPLVYRTSLRSIINGNDTDVVLAAGDIVYVTEEWTAHTGEVMARIANLITDPATIALTAAILVNQ